MSVSYQIDKAIFVAWAVSILFTVSFWLVWIYVLYHLIRKIW